MQPDVISTPSPFLPVGADAFPGAFPTDALAPGGHRVDPVDQTRFENAMEDGVQGVSVSPAASPSTAEPVAKPTLGDAILEKLKSLKEAGTSMKQELISTVEQDDLNPASMLRLQYHMMTVNLELQTTTNMAHHGVEDVKTIMRGQ